MSIELAINKLYHKTTQGKIEWTKHGPYFLTKFKRWSLILHKDSLKINQYNIVLPEVDDIYNWLRFKPLKDPPKWVHEFMESIIKM